MKSPRLTPVALRYQPVSWRESYVSNTWRRDLIPKSLLGKSHWSDLNRRPLGSCEWLSRPVIDRYPLIRRLFGLPKGRRPARQSYLSHTYDTGGASAAGASA